MRYQLRRLLTRQRTGYRIEAYRCLPFNTQNLAQVPGVK